MKIDTSYSFNRTSISRKCYVKIIHLKDFFHCFTYFLNFGTNAWFSPTANTLTANIGNEMKQAGKNNVHQCPDKIALNESFAITPQLAEGAWMPSPIKLKNASAKIAVGTVNVICTIMGPIVFGSKFFRMILDVFAPKD